MLLYFTNLSNLVKELIHPLTDPNLLYTLLVLLGINLKLALLLKFLRSADVAHSLIWPILHRLGVRKPFETSCTLNDLEGFHDYYTFVEC